MSQGKKLTDDEVDHIKKLVDEHLTNMQIRERTGLGHSCVSHIRSSMKKKKKKKAK